MYVFVFVGPFNLSHNGLVPNRHVSMDEPEIICIVEYILLQNFTSKKFQVYHVHLLKFSNRKREYVIISNSEVENAVPNFTLMHSQVKNGKFLLIVVDHYPWMSAFQLLLSLF